MISPRDNPRSTYNERQSDGNHSIKGGKYIYKYQGNLWQRSLTDDEYTLFYIFWIIVAKLLDIAIWGFYEAKQVLFTE